MRVGIITTWNQRCGIAEYSRDLLEQLKGRVDPVIIPTDVALDFPRFKLIIKEFTNPDALLFMYQPAIISFENLKKWVYMFHSLTRHPKLFILAHEVLDGENWSELVKPPDVKVDGVIVHSKHVLDWAYVVPHPCKVYPKIPKEKAKSQTGLEKYEPIITTFGFPFPLKRFDIVIEAFRTLQSKYPNALLLMICSKWKDESATALEEVKLKTLASNLNVKFISDKYEVDEFMPYLFTSDIFVTSQETEDKRLISGSCLMGFTARIPTVTNNCMIYSQIHPYSRVVQRGNPTALADAIIELLENDKLYQSMQTLSEEAYETFNWNRQAENFLKIFYEHFWKEFKLRDPPSPSYVRPLVSDDSYLSSDQSQRLNWIRKNVPKGFLEIGSSIGYIIKTCGGDCGVDIDRRRLSVAQSQKINSILASATHMPIKDKAYEIVIIPELLEHLPPEESLQIIREAKRVGKEVYFTVPDMLKAKYYADNPERQWLIDSPEHLWLVTEQSLTELFRMAGCRIKYERVGFSFVGKIVETGRHLDALILAAGYSTRMKENKHLLLINGETVIARQVRMLRQLGVEDITVVTREDDEPVRNMIKMLEAKELFTFTSHINAFEELKAIMPYLNGDTLILLGDLLYTQNALQFMLNKENGAITVFGVTKPTEWCNKDWAKPDWYGEIFALKFKKDYVRQAEKLLKSLPMKYYDLWNIPYQLNLPITTVEECLDIDNEIDYATGRKLVVEKG
jgi:glycosyltransferase involved in cell wall biosynthesis/GTP:adenosylcobinamide-phosphate guanylyltransferase/predicted SAM-dependent methyltransferase